MTASVLMISKPVAPPWNDSSKNLVKDLATCGSRYTYTVLTPRDYELAGARVTSEPLYPPRHAGHRYSPPVVQNLRVLRRLLQRDQSAVTHFFFAPNARASAAAALALRLRPRPTVQTVCSVPASFAEAHRLLFADRVVTVSDHTRRAFEAAGIPSRRLATIPPGIQIPPLPAPEQRARARWRHGLPQDRPVVVYPGDYQFSSAAETVARAVPLLRDLSITVVFACRAKQRLSLRVERRIQQMLTSAGVLHMTRALGEVDDMLELLAASDVCVLPAESMYAKMDLPLVLLEALALGVPLVLADCPPLSELLRDDCGVGVPPQDPRALAAAIRELALDPRRRQRMALAARQLAAARYDIAAVSRRYEELYDELLG